MRSAGRPDVTDEEGAISRHAGIQPHARDGPAAEILERPLDADADPERPLAAGEGAAADASDANRHRQVAALFAELMGEHLAAAIGRGIDALDPPARDAPVLAR